MNMKFPNEKCYNLFNYLNKFLNFTYVVLNWAGDIVLR